MIPSSFICAFGLLFAIVAFIIAINSLAIVKRARNLQRYKDALEQYRKDFEKRAKSPIKHHTVELAKPIKINGYRGEFKHLTIVVDPLLHYRDSIIGITVTAEDTYPSNCFGNDSLSITRQEPFTPKCPIPFDFGLDPKTSNKEIHFGELTHYGDV